jgi:hypothetical protein
LEATLRAGTIRRPGFFGSFFGEFMGPTLIRLAGVVNIVCFILVLIAMYEHKKILLMIVCIVLSLAFFAGGLVAFVYGWMQAKSWNVLNFKLLNVMYVWSGALLVVLIFVRDVRALISFLD